MTWSCCEFWMWIAKNTKRTIALPNYKIIQFLPQCVTGPKLKKRNTYSPGTTGKGIRFLLQISREKASPANCLQSLLLCPIWGHLCTQESTENISAACRYFLTFSTANVPLWKRQIILFSVQYFFIDAECVGFD